MSAHPGGPWAKNPEGPDWANASDAELGLEPPQPERVCFGGVEENPPDDHGDWTWEPASYEGNGRLVKDAEDRTVGWWTRPLREDERLVS